MAQINTTIGDLSGNMALILRTYSRFVQAGAYLALYPELSVCGYPPRDLLERADFVTRCKESLRESVAEILAIPAVIGGPIPSAKNPEKPLSNAAVIAQDGETIFTHRKTLRTDYDVFDENRYFEPGSEIAIWEYQENRFAITICEDLLGRRFRHQALQA